MAESNENVQMLVKIDREFEKWCKAAERFAKFHQFAHRIDTNYLYLEKR